MAKKTPRTIYTASGPKPRRKARIAFPVVLGREHVDIVSQWPLGAYALSKAGRECPPWLDVILHFNDTARTGGKHNARRVRYDGGSLCVSVNGARVYLDAALSADVLACGAYVYGGCKKRDKTHNDVLKGFT